MVRRVVLLLAVLAEFSTLRAAENSPLGEYQIKAAFLYNFGRFVEWPTNALQRGSSPIILGVLGDDPFGRDLELTVAGKKIDEHPLVIQRITADHPTQFCHILFVSRSERRRLPQILNSLRNSPTLTVADEIGGFCQQGGMINFVMVGNKVRFQINGPAAQRAGLKISSKLLRLAEEPNAVP